MQIYAALVENDGEQIRLVFTAEDMTAARARASERLVEGDRLTTVSLCDEAGAALELAELSWSEAVVAA